MVVQIISMMRLNTQLLMEHTPTTSQSIMVEQTFLVVFQVQMLREHTPTTRQIMVEQTSSGIMFPVILK